jgi:hypothetical protein
MIQQYPRWQGALEIESLKRQGGSHHFLWYATSYGAFALAIYLIVKTVVVA